MCAIGGISTDISELKRQQESLRRSEERFDLTVRGSGDGIWDYDVATGENWFSDRFRELLGYNNEQDFPNVVESWSNGLHPDDRQSVVDTFMAHLEKDVPYDVEFRMMTKTGEYRWFRARCTSLRDRNRTIVSREQVPSPISPTGNRQSWRWPPPTSEPVHCLSQRLMER